ncbi:hypothetical protein [Arthrobacter sp. H35-D1]|uniref:hypothetical protein n=1 Tax=Arthrobacter sp. H35-D1 TaxID=3046202 RepID=UPI0024BA1E46|nr:hypothetical protein [Arthrobacter sp. H35-D1]MDJ0312275.1 hypothetical protein [Arthrobacter sp. H35-D1]
MSDFMRHAVRRETHSARSGLSTVAAIAITLVAVYGLLEAMLAALGEPPWLLSPISGMAWVAALPGGHAPVLLGVIGVLLALVGLVFLGQGLLPRRRARHVIAHPRVAIVVEDEVIASALAKSARMAAGVTREQVVVVVSARQVQVNIRPTSGIRISEGDIKAAVEGQLEAMALEPAPSVAVRLADSGVIGV